MSLDCRHPARLSSGFQPDDFQLFIAPIHLDRDSDRAGCLIAGGLEARSPLKVPKTDEGALSQGHCTDAVGYFLTPLGGF